MKKIVTVPLPLNITDRYKWMYESYLSYQVAPLKIKKLKNVFITFTGFCVNNKGLIKESHHSYPLQYQDYLKEASFYYYDALDHPENLITLDDDNIYTTIHHPWFNYFHWLTESIFRLWMVRHHLDKVILILPEYYKSADFIVGSLEPFKIKKVFYIPSEKSVLIKNLWLPPIKPICDSFNSKHLSQVRSFYRNYVTQQTKISTFKTTRLYVSRELAGRRKVVNEDEVLKIIKKHEFTVFHPENFPFLEQVAIFLNVKYLIGTHGSGLTNMLFMGVNTSLLELHKNKTNELDHPSPLFWYMAEALQINYFHQLCETHGKEDYFVGDYIIDTNLLEENIIKMLS